MDTILTEFIQRTKADPALAQDLLEATEWNLDMAIVAFDSLQETKAVEPEEYVYDPKDFESITTFPEVIFEGEDIDLADPTNSNMEENEAKRREMVKRKKVKRSRGLSFADADEVIDKFGKVAVIKQRVSTKEQIIIDEQFFHHSFVYPDFSTEDAELQEYIAKDLLEISHKRALERSGRLNWWTSTGRLPKLEPLATTGDGNCLLHAASLYMWGFHDHNLILRTALHRLLTSGLEREGIKRRWKYQTQLRNDEAGGLTFTEEEWEFEWGEILRIATNRPRRQPMTDSLRRHSSLRMSYESLEEIHISVLAHTLRRPIVVISDRTIKDMSGQDLAPIYFGGIYLPVEVNPTTCHMSPVVLAYDSSHFSPLVAIQDNKQQPHAKYARMSSRVETVIPLVTPDGSLLPVQFVYDPKKKNVAEKWSKMEYEVGEFPDDIIRLLESYMNIRWIQLKVSSSTSASEDYDHIFPVQVPKVRFPAACIMQETQPIYQKDLVEKYLKHIQARFHEDKETQARREAEREEEERKRQLNKIVPCEGEGCEMFGRPATNNLCSVCYEKSLSGPEPGLELPDLIPSGSPVPEDDFDVADLHRTVPPLELPQDMLDLIAHGEQLPDYGDGHKMIQQGATRLSPLHSAPMANHMSAQTNEPKRPLAPLLSAENQGANAHQSSKQPIYPPKYLPPRPTSHSPDENAPKSRSPTPPPKPSPSHSKSPTKESNPALPSPSKGASHPPKEAPPPSSKGATPPPSKRASPSSPKSSETASAKSPVKWASNLVPNRFKKASSPSHSAKLQKSSGGKYSRDNILPLHLEPASSDPAADADKDPGKRNCKTVNCEFHGSPGCAGYCSTCYKVLKDNATVI